MRIESMQYKIYSDDVDKGIYLFKPESATGKTMMCRNIKLLRERDIAVRYFTYRDYIDQKPVSVIPDDLILFVVDRYDRYVNNELNDKIRAISQNGLVLIDLKQEVPYDCKLEIDGVVDINMISPFELEVIIEDEYS